MQNAERSMQTVKPLRAAALLACCILAFALATGCARARAASVPEGPPLAIPLPPPHEIVVEQVAEAAPPEPPPAVEPAPPAPRPTVTRTPARQEPRAEAPAPAAAPAAATPPPGEVREVRVAPAAASAADERRVRDLLARAAGDLKDVDYKRLSNDGKAQYDQSKRFSDEAQQAIKERNFVYALTLAEKAATLAGELVR